MDVLPNFDSAKAKAAEDAKPPREPLPLLYAADIHPVLESADFVQGVLIERTASVIYGESNSGKTFFATDLALSVAAGRLWQEREVEQGGVIYCVLEGGMGFRNRVVAWIKEHGVDPVTLPFAAIPAAINLLDPAADTEALIAAIREAAAKMGIPVKLVVIDTLSRALSGGNENAPDDMGALVQNVDRVRAETGAAVIFVHHSGKDQAKGARGHSLLRAAVDTEIEVVDNSGAHTATVVKQRDLPKGAAFGFRLKVVELGTDRRGNPVTTCIVEPAQAETRSRMSGSEAAALKVLADLIGAEGVPLPGLSGFPSGLSGVPEDRWRAECDTRRVPSNAAEKDSRTKAFRRAYAGLQRASAASARDGLVWIVRGEQ